MQHPKKIIRTNKIATHTSKEEESVMNLRRVDRRSPSISSKDKQRISESMDKSTGSLQLSKSSNQSSLIRNTSKLSKQQSIELTLNEEESKLQRELNELKRMQLSPEIRDRLFKLQRYDRNYKKESERQLGKILEQEMKRLQKIRGSDKDMSVSMYDTELLVRCLVDQRSLLSEVQKQLSDEVQQLVRVKNQMDQNTSFVSRSSSRQINVSSQQIGSPLKRGSQKQISKQLQTGINFSIRALSNRQYPEAKLQISKFKQKAKKERGFEFYVKMITQMEAMADEMEQDEKNIKLMEEENSKMTKNLELSNKYVRENRWSDLQRLNLRLSQVKGSKQQISLTLLIESVLENNKLKMKQINSRSRQKISSISPEKIKPLQIQTLRKQITKRTQELKQYKKKLQTMEQERVLEKMELAKLRSSIDKERITASIKQAQQKHGTNLNNPRQVNKAEQQRRTIESKTRSLQHSKKNNQQKIQMLEKKNKSLQLMLKCSNEQLKTITSKLSFRQKEFNEALTKIKKFQQRQKRKQQRQSNPMNQTPQKINIQELKILQNDFNELSRQKQQEEYNFIAIIQQKDQKIKQLELKLSTYDSLIIEGNQNCNQLVKLQLEQKDRELIKIKKQLIQSLETHHLKPTKTINNQSQSISPLQQLSNQIIEIHERKHEQTLSQGFSIQFNNIQRQQWRQISKKLKQHKKKHPNNKFISYFEQRHKHQFELTQKLTDYQEKLLAIHNQLYRVKSIVSNTDTIPIRSNSASKVNSKIQTQQGKWWQNVQIIHVKERTEFAKLFNDLIDEITKFYRQSPYHPQKTLQNNSKTTDHKRSLSHVKDAPPNSNHQNNLKHEELVKDKKSLLLQIQEIQKILRDLTNKLNNPQKAETIIFTNPQHLRKQISQLKTSNNLPTLSTTIINLSNSYVHLLNSRQIHHAKIQSELSGINKTLSQSLSDNQKQLNEIKQKFTQIDKEKKIIEKNLSYKSREIQEKQTLKDRIIELQEIVKGLSYYKQLVQQQQQIVSYLIEINNTQGHEQISQEKREGTTPPTAMSKSSNKKIQNNTITKTSKKLKSQKPSDILRPLHQFIEKHRQNSKTVEYIEKIKVELQNQYKTHSENRELIVNVGYVIGEFVQVLRPEQSINYEGKLSRLERNSQNLNQLIKNKGQQNVNARPVRRNQSSSIKSPHKLESNTDHAKDNVKKQENPISEQLNQFNSYLIDMMRKGSQTIVQNKQLKRKLSIIQLANEQMTRQMGELQDMQAIFNFIIEKKIFLSKNQPLPQLVQNQSNINKNPEIIREIFEDEIKKKLKLNSSPITMLKKKNIPTNTTTSITASNNPQSSTVNNQTTSPQRAMSEQCYSLSDFSMKTSRIEERSNSIIETTLRLFSKINQMHITYQDSVISRFQESRVKYTQTYDALKQTNERLETEIAQLKNQLNQQLKTHESKITASNQSQHRLSLIQAQLEELREKYKGLQKEKKQLQVVNKKLQMVKKQLQDEKLLLDKLFEFSLTKDTQNPSSHIETVGNTNIKADNSLSGSVINRAASNQTSTVSKKSSSLSKQGAVSNSAFKQGYLNRQAQQKKQVLLFKRQHPKSKLITYIQSVSRKLSDSQIKVRSLQEQKESVIAYYNQLVTKMQVSPVDWFKAPEFSSSKPNIRSSYYSNQKSNSYGSSHKVSKLNSQLMTIVSQFTKQVVENRRQIQSLSISCQQTTNNYQQLNQSIKNDQSVQSSVLSLGQILQSLQKTLKNKNSVHSKEKDQLFTNEMYMKNLLQSEIKKKKGFSNNLQSITVSLSSLLNQISLIIKSRQAKKSEELNHSKTKLTKQKEQLNQKLLDSNQKNKQLQLSNKELSVQNKLLTQSIKKLQSSLHQLQNKSTQTMDKSKQYELLRLKQTIESYVSQQTKLQVNINKLQKDKKQLERQIGKLKEENKSLRQQTQDINEQLHSMSRLVETMKQQHGQKDNSFSENQLIVNNLKSSYFKTQKELQSIQHKIASLLQQKTYLNEEKSALQQQINKLKQQHKREKSLLDKELSSKKQACETLQKNHNKLQKDYQQLNLKIKHLESTHQLQLTHQSSIIQKLQLQLKDAANRQKREKDQLNKRVQALNQQRKQLIQREHQHLQEYRQKIQQIQSQHEMNKSSEVKTFHKEIQDISKSYSQVIKQYEKEKLSIKQNSLKTTHEHQQIINKLNHQLSTTTQAHQQLLNKLNIDHLQQINSLNTQLQSSLHSSHRFEQELKIKGNQLAHAINEKLQMTKKLVILENSLQELTLKLQLSQTKLLQSQKNCLRLTPYQRKIQHYEHILLINNITIDQSSEHSINKTSNHKSSKTSSHLNHSNSHHNSLQSRLNQIQSLKDQNNQLKSNITNLTIQLQKQLSQKQFIKHNSQLNRQDYIKLSAQSKQQLRCLRQENKILIYQKNILDNQLVHYKQTIKRINEKNLDLEQQLRNNIINHEKNIIQAKDILQKEFDFITDSKDKTITEKTHLINSLETQLLSIKQRLQHLDQSLRIKQIDMIELQSKLKQTQLKSKSHTQKQQIIFQSQNAQLQKQITSLKDSLNQMKFKLQLNAKDLQFYKANYEQRLRQVSSLKCELQSIEKLSLIEKSNYETKIRQIQLTMNNLSEQMDENSRAQYHQRMMGQNKQSSQIKLVKMELTAKNQQHQSLLNLFHNLQSSNNGKDIELNQLKRTIHQLETKLNSKILQVTNLSQKNFDLDLKNKEFQRNHKFETLQLKAQLQSTNRVFTELQQRYHALQTQIQEGRNPFSPSSNAKFQAKQHSSHLVQRENLYNQNLTLKKNLQTFRYKIQQLQSHLAHSKSKIADLTPLADQCHHLKLITRSLEQKLASSRASLEQLLSKQRQLEQSKSYLQEELQQLNSEYIKAAEISRLELDKSRNSLRVLDHELIQYKSKLQNIQQCLKQQKDKTYQYKIQIQQFKKSKYQPQLSPKNTLNSQEFLESHSHQLKLQNHNLQKKILTQNHLISQLQQSNTDQTSLIERLSKDLSTLKYENEHLLFANQQNLHFITSSNQKLHELFSLLQTQFSSNVSLEFSNQAEFDLIIEISNRTYQLLEENKSLKNQCRTLQEKIHILKMSSDTDYKHKESVALQMQNLIQNMISYASMHDVAIEQQMRENIYEPYECLSVSQVFDRGQKKLKNLMIVNSEVNDQSELIARYEKSVEKIKKLIRLYIEQKDMNALQSLREIANS